MKHGFFLSSLLICLLAYFHLPSVQAQELYQWQSLGPYNDWPFPFNRHEHAFVEANGKMYLIGGRGNKPVQIFDPTTNTWEMGAEPPLEIHHMQLVHLNGKIYVMGAFTGNFPNEDPVGNVLIYDIASDSWQWGANIPGGRQRGSTGVVLYNDKIYMICGIIDGHSSGWVKWLDVYDPANNSWQQLPDAPHARDHFHASLVGDKIVVAGGRRSGADGVFNATVGEVDVYDISDNSWSTIATIPTQRAGTSVATIGNEVLVIGGESGSQFAAHDEVQALNITNGSWRSLDPLNQGRHGFQAAVFNNAIYVAGGSIERGANELNHQDPNYVEVFYFDEQEVPPSAPQASFTASATNGPAPLQVRFDASASTDADGTITSYVWDFGDGTTATGLQAGHTFGEGTFTVTLTVTDDEGLSASKTLSISAYDPDRPRVLFVAEMQGGDQAILTHLQNQGYQVEVKSAVGITTADATGAQLVITSSTVNSNDLGQAFTSLSVPVINWEPALYDDLLMTASAAPEFLGWMGEQSVAIVNPEHPLAAGQTGTVQLYTGPEQVAWANPMDAGTTVGVAASAPAQTLLFAYEAGTPLPGGGTAAGRRIGFPLGDNAANNFTADGWSLFDAAVCWALGCNAIEVSLQASATAGPLPLEVSFDASASAHAYGNIASYLWQFGEGSTSTEVAPTFTYTELGTYEVILTLGDTYGNTASDTLIIEVLPAPPTAVLTAQGDSAYAPAFVTFDTRASSDADGTIKAFYLSYGNGQADSLQLDSLSAPLLEFPPIDTVVRIDTLPRVDTVLVDIPVGDSLLVDTVLVDTFDLEIITLDSLQIDSILQTREEAQLLSDSLWLDSLLQPTYTYTRPGLFQAILAVEDNDGALGYDTLAINILNRLPVASLEADTLSGKGPLTLTFDGRSSGDPDGQLVSYELNFGDGRIDTLRVDTTFADSLLVFEHTYPLAGSYPVSLVVTDELGGKDTASLQVEVINTAPLAVANGDPLAGMAPMEAFFYSDGSVDRDGDIVSYLWSFPDGSQDTTATSSYVFDRWGTYAVFLTVTDNLGASSRDTLLVYMENQSPLAQLEADPLVGPYPLTVNASALTSSDVDGDIVSYQWNLGDSLLAQTAEATFEFTEIGTYTLQLKVTDDAGAFSLDTVSITVTDLPKDILFVTGAATLNASDQRVKELVEGMGFQVVHKTDVAAGTADADEKAAVIISSTSNSGDVNTKFRDVSTPVLTWESYLYDDLHMTGGVQGTDYLFAYNKQQVNVLMPDHPLAAGLQGGVNVYQNQGVMAWGNPGAGAINVATVMGNPNQHALFAYETGAQMVNLTAPGKRVGLFLQDNEATALSQEGIALLEAAICWATSCGMPQARRGMAAESSLSAYPIPARSLEGLNVVVQAAGGQGQLMLISLSGQVMHQQTISLDGTRSIKLPLEGISSGVYQLMLRTNAYTLRKKVVVID